MLSSSWGTASKQSFPYWCLSFPPKEILAIICMMPMFKNYPREHKLRIATGIARVVGVTSTMSCQRRPSVEI
ncbi:hypothetical protein TorRG33x02_148600 [Trema orientale]|uniref:Uncharacterized protein n=1 Tax=Trema orientale TaxID=63057 RepID=A0A2P5EUX9_TREOI|nr:hypothetical protein TorRG33x02_148600 [Trema orientale]